MRGALLVALAEMGDDLAPMADRGRYADSANEVGSVGEERGGVV